MTGVRMHLTQIVCLRYWAWPTHSRGRLAQRIACLRFWAKARRPLDHILSCTQSVQTADSEQPITSFQRL